MRTVTKIGVWTGVALVLLVAAAAAAPLLISAQRFIPELEKQASAALGVPVQVGSLRLRPGLGIRAEAGGLRVGPREGARPLEVDRLVISLRLWPLLRGEVRLGSVTADGVRLRLRRSAAKQWQPEGGFGSLKGGPGGPATAPPAAGAAGSTPAGAGGGAAFPVDRVALRDVQITFIDPAAAAPLRRGWTLGPARAELETPTASRPWRFSLHAELGGSAPPAAAGGEKKQSEKGGISETVAITGSLPSGSLADAVVSLEIDDLSVGAASVLMAIAGMKMPEGVQAGTLGGRLDVRGLGGAAAREPAARIVPGYEAAGQLELSDLQIRLGAGNRARTVRVDAGLRLEGPQATLSPLKVRIGEERIEGSAVWRAGTPPELSGELHSPQLDLDAVLALLEAPATAAPPSATLAGGRGEGKPGPAPASGTAPPEARGKLTVKIDSGRLLGLVFSDARIETALDRGRLGLQSLSVSLYGGGIEGSGSLVMGREPLPFELETRVQGVDLEGALPALRADLKGALTGRFSGGLSLRGAGVSTADLNERLGGRLSLELRDGRLQSLSVLRQVATLLEVAGGKGIGKEYTPYKSLTGDFTIAQGRARTRNLALRSEDLDLDGQGSFGLDSTLEFDVDGRFSPGVSAAMVEKTPALRHLIEKDGRLRIRFLMRGPLASPRVEIDQAFLRSRLKRAVEERGREKLRDRLKDLLR